MQKVTLIIASLGLILGSLAIGKSFFQTSSPTKIAFMDSNVVLDNYKGMLDARKSLEKEMDQWKTNIDSLQSELEEEIKLYEKEIPKLTASDKDDRLKKLQNKQTEFQKYQQAVTQKAQKKEVELNGEVVKMMNQYLTEYGESHDYEILLGANGSGNIIYGGDGLDITEKVIAYLNDRYEKGI